MKLILKILIPMFMAVTAQSAMASDPLPVFVSIVPQKYIVQQIGKDRVDARVMVKPGASPATYEPKPAQMAALSKTRLYFSIGVPFETYWLEKIASANPDMRVVHTDEGIQKIPMAAHHHHDEEEGHHEDAHHDGDHHEKAGDHHKAHKGHEHNHHDAHHDGDHHDEASHEDDHGHEGLDPHIWMSPALVKVQAGHILSALVAEDPANKDFYTRNHAAFIEKATALDNELREMFRGKQGMRFMVFHPAWGYFAHDYGLEMIPIEIQGKDPKPAQLKELIKHARENHIKVIFVQPQFSAKSAKLVAREIKGQVATADPLAFDWAANMRAMADKFKEALK